MKDIIFEKWEEKFPKIKVLDKGFVELIDCMPRLVPDNEDSADYAIAEAARCSYQKGTKTVLDDKSLINYLMRHNHTSPFEMIEFKFYCKMPIFVAREWIRHRTASVNELSARYSKMEDDYYIPSRLRLQSLTNKQGSEGDMEEEVEYQMLDSIEEIGEISYTTYEELLDGGVCREQARMVLPINYYTEWYWKIDLKNLLHFLNLRCDLKAQEEIRVYADAILKLIKPIIPWTIEAWEQYSPYRGAMLLTQKEVKALSEMTCIKLDEDKPDFFKDIDSDSKSEKREWKEKAKKLGLLLT
jgi:thymidylate synthase (FAD)